jgi:hypothetical protein
LEVLRECGVATMGGIVLWGMGVKELGRWESILAGKSEQSSRRERQVLRKSA